MWCDPDEFNSDDFERMPCIEQTGFNEVAPESTAGRIYSKTILFDLVVSLAISLGVLDYFVGLTVVFKNWYLTIGEQSGLNAFVLIVIAVDVSLFIALTLLVASILRSYKHSNTKVC